MQGALSGVRVLDFSEYIAGPYCRPDAGRHGRRRDQGRAAAGRLLAPLQQIAPSESRGFIGVNKGKKQHLHRPQAPRGQGDRAPRRRVHRRRHRRTTVPASPSASASTTTTALRHQPAHHLRRNTGFGTSGPYAGRAGFDLVAQAMTGIMAYEGNVGMPRSIITSAVTDVASGMFIAFAVASALYQREQTGRGQRIETRPLRRRHRHPVPAPALDRDDRPRGPRPAHRRPRKRAAKRGTPYEEVMGERRPGRTTQRRRPLLPHLRSARRLHGRRLPQQPPPPRRPRHARHRRPPRRRRRVQRPTPSAPTAPRRSSHEGGASSRPEPSPSGAPIFDATACPPAPSACPPRCSRTPTSSPTTSS